MVRAGAVDPEAMRYPCVVFERNLLHTPTTH